MARIIYPKTLYGWSKLTTDIKAKHESDGNDSPLKTFLIENPDIVLADIIAGFEGAITQDILSNTKERLSEEMKKARDIAIKIPTKQMRPIIQVLKKLYPKNVRRVGEWGVTIDNNSKVVFPTTFEGKVQLWLDISDKHATYNPATDSPIYQYITANNVNMAELSNKTTEAFNRNNDFKAASMAKEDATAARDLLSEPNEEFIHDICQYLKEFFRDNKKSLGQYGIRVDDSRQLPRLRVSKVGPSAQKIVRNAVINGFFTNTGNTILKIYEGKTVVGDGITLNPGEKFLLRKGFNSFLVVNQHNNAMGNYSVDVHN